MSEKLKTNKKGNNVDLGKDVDPKKGDGTWENPGEFPEYNDQPAGEQVDDAQDKEAEPTLDESIAEIFTEMNKIKTAEVPEGKFRLPDACYSHIMELTEAARKKDDPTIAKEMLTLAQHELKQAMKLNGEVDAEVGEKLWALFDDPEISVGVHGTVAEADSDFGTENTPVFSQGLGCGYGDLRRTIAFQDRGMVHAHGNVTFIDLLSYSYPSAMREKPLTVKKMVKHEEKRGESGITFVNYEEEKVPAKQYGVIVAIPKGVSTIDESLRGDKIETGNNSPFSVSGKKDSKPLKSEFIVGVMSDADPNSIVWNPEFNVDHVKELGKQREAELQAQKEAEAQQETASSQEDKKPRGGIFGRIFGRNKNQ